MSERLASPQGTRASIGVARRHLSLVHDPATRSSVRERVGKARQPAPTTDTSGFARGTVVATSPDDGLSFALRKRPGGMWVQRSEIGSSGTRVVEALLFADAAAFSAWCRSDPMRFTYPLLFSRLTRSAERLFEHGA